METDLLITLQNYGFSEKEAKIYLTTLELGSSIASTIARRAGIKRVTAYSILKDLKNKGIVNEITKEDTKFFSVISPELLLKQLEQKYELFKEKIPELLAMAEKFGDKPKLTFYEGVNGIKALYDELLQHKEDIFAFLSDDNIVPELNNYLNNIFVKKRLKAGIHASVIISDTHHNQNYIQKTQDHGLTDLKIITDKLNGIEGEIILFGKNKVACAMYSNQELSGYIINSDQLYNSFKTIFNFIWNSKQK